MIRILLTLVFFCTSVPSFAAEKLTEQKIKDFYKQSVAVQLKGAKPAIAFFEKHIHDDSKITLNMITNIKGAPPQKQTVNHDKKSLMKDTRTGYKTSKLESLNTSVLSVKISKDGTSANVKDTTFGISIINVSTPGGIAVFKAEQSMLCDSVVVLEKTVMQSKDSVCNVEVKMAPVK